MQKGAQPDSSADYWEERDTIEKNLNDLKQSEEDMSAVMKAFQKKKSKTLQLLQQDTTNSDNESLAKYSKEL